jgi:putative addiction module component (TIGR02574 family)
MNPNAQRLLDEARQLSPDEREWLAERLLIDDERISAAEVESAWDAEIKRRLDEIDSGAVKMIPGEEVLARMETRLKAKQQQVAPQE